MATTTCVREAEVLELVVIGQWPERAESALQAHVADCRICAELAATATAIASIAESPDVDVRVPDASLVWRRAALDAHRDATRRAVAPMAFVQLAAVVALAGLVWALRADAFAWLSQGWHAVSLPPGGIQPASGERVLALMAEWAAAPTVRWSVLAVAVSAALILLAWPLVSLADRGPDGDSRHHSRP